MLPCRLALTRSFPFEITIYRIHISYSHEMFHINERLIDIDLSIFVHIYVHTNQYMSKCVQQLYKWYNRKRSPELLYFVIGPSRRHLRKMALGGYMQRVSASTGLAEETHQITTQNFGRQNIERFTLKSASFCQQLLLCDSTNVRFSPKGWWNISVLPTQKI